MTLIQILESREKALTIHEVAKLLGVSDKHVYEMAADGSLPAFHIGRSIRIDPQDLADWLRKKKPAKVQQIHQDSHKRQNTNPSMRENTSVEQTWRKKVRSLESALALGDDAD